MPSATRRSDAPPLPRAELPVARSCTYLDTAYASPLPRRAIAALEDDARAAAHGATEIVARDAALEGLRASVADLVGVPHPDVALVPNTTHGMGVVAHGLDWRPGDRVLVRADDHASTIVPWRVQAHRGVTVTAVEARTGDALLSALAAELERGSVRAVATSWVHAYTGERIDLAAVAALAHDHGALLCVDGIQGVGVVPAQMSAWGVDLVALGAQKWTLGPHGIGAVALRPELAERLEVPTASDESLAAPWTGGEPILAAGPRRFEAGSPSYAGGAAWAASLGLLAEAGVERVWGWCDRLAMRLVEGCRAQGIPVRSSTDPATRSAIVLVDVPGIDAAEAVRLLAEDDVVVSARAGGVRASIAGWNDEGDIDVLVSGLAAL